MSKHKHTGNIEHAGNPSIAQETWKPRRYFEEPDADKPPLTPREIMAAVLLGHLGVATAKRREDDFHRANGLHMFIGAMLYTALVMGGLIALSLWLAK